MNKKNNITELVFIIDKSGSMSGLENDTIGGFNSMLEKHRKEQGSCNISTVFFADRSEVVHNRENIAKVEPLTRNNYVPGGCTALLDALGDAINHTIKIQKKLADDQKASNVVFVIITDGQENASKHFSVQEIKRQISFEQEKYGWEFIFLGANIDAVNTAASYGIKSNRAANFVCDSKGIDLNFSGIANFLGCVRKKQAIPDSWASEIEEDYQQRK